MLQSSLYAVLLEKARSARLKVTMRLDRNRHVLSLTGADAGIEASWLLHKSGSEL